MARTYRKKDSLWQFQKWENYDWVKYRSKYGGVYEKKVYFQKESKEYQKALRVFHSQKSCNGVSSWFCNLYFQRALRRKTKNLLGSWKEEILFPEFKKRAAWDWY